MSFQYYSHLFLLSIVVEKSLQWANNESLSWKHVKKSKEIKPPVNECQRYEDSERKEMHGCLTVYIKSEIFLL